MTIYYVIDADGNPSWDAKKDQPQSFGKREAAYKRAVEIAEAEPGRSVHIATAIEVVIAPVGNVERRKI